MISFSPYRSLYLSICFIAFAISFSFGTSDSLKSKGIRHAFDADHSNLMKIIVNNIYKDKSVFLRELISNSFDALSKLQHEHLVGSLTLHDDHEFKITIKVIPELRQLIITDTGIGMTKDDLIKHLGTIAGSGTREFSKKLAEASQSKLIGQFGVGFYSLFLVADSVKVFSKNQKDKLHIWSCRINDGHFDIIEATEEDVMQLDEPLLQGTKIVLHIKDDPDVEEYLSVDKLETLIHTHSEFIGFPIYIYKTTTISSEVPIEEEDDSTSKKDDSSVTTEESSQHPDLMVEEVKETKEDSAPKTKTVTTTESKFTQVNTNKPIWTRNPSSVSNEEYIEFYKAISRDSNPPLYYHHYHVEGKTTAFTCIIFIPRNPPFEAFSKDEPPKSIKLHVNKVFITDDFDNLLDRSFAFLNVVVDADYLPLNVSREILQKNKTLLEIRDSIISKYIHMLNKMSKDPTIYDPFYKAYSSHLKLSVLNEKDEERKTTLVDHLKFHSSFSRKNTTTFSEYVSRMKPNQTEILYATGSSVREIKNHPMMKGIINSGYEVIYMNEPYDEYLVQSLPSFKSKTLRNISKSGLKLDNESEEEKKSMEEASVRFKPLVTYLKKLFSNSIEKVSFSNMLGETPMAISSNQFGWSPSMEKLMKQNKNNPMLQFFGSQKKIMEIHPSHPLIIGLLDRIVKNPDGDSETEQAVKLLYDAALLHSGYELKNPAEFAHRVENMIRLKYGVSEKQEPSDLHDDELNEFPPPMPDFSQEDMNMPDFSNFDFNDNHEHPTSEEDINGAAHDDATEQNLFEPGEFDENEKFEL